MFQERLSIKTTTKRVWDRLKKKQNFFYEFVKTII